MSWDSLGLEDYIEYGSPMECMEKESGLVIPIISPQRLMGSPNFHIQRYSCEGQIPPSSSSSSSIAPESPSTNGCPPPCSPAEPQEHGVDRAIGLHSPEASTFTEPGQRSRQVGPSEKRVPNIFTAQMSETASAKTYTGSRSVKI